MFIPVCGAMPCSIITAAYPKFEMVLGRSGVNRWAM